MANSDRKFFLWIEDQMGKSGYTFWNIFMQQLAPSVIVESKKNNSELVKAVKELSDNENRYIILFDNSFDNLQVYQEQKLLKTYVEGKKNVSLMNIICFEYILLEFDWLLRWIYAPEDEFLEKRVSAIQARSALVTALRSGTVDYKELRAVIEYDTHLDQHNIEQLSAKLLFDLTRNTGFEVSKKSLGECWIKSCCEWTNRHKDDICGLDENRLSLKEKMIQIYEKTSLKRELSCVGLEVDI